MCYLSVLWCGPQRGLRFEPLSPAVGSLLKITRWGFSVFILEVILDTAYCLWKKTPVLQRGDVLCFLKTKRLPVHLELATKVTGC